MSFQNLKDIEIDLDKNLHGSDDDIIYNHNLKIISQNYLKENKYQLGEEPDVEKFSIEEFTKFIEEKSSKNSTMIEKFEEKEVELNFRSLMSNIYKDDKGNKIFVFFLPTDKNKKTVSIDNTKIFCYLILYFGCNQGLLISKKKLSSICNDKLESSNINSVNNSNVYNTVCYVDCEFLPINKHALQPKILNIYRYPDDVKKFREENNMIDVKKFSRISLNDPLVKFYRGNLNDIFYLERTVINENNMLSTYKIFRIVVKINFNVKKSSK